MSHLDSIRAAARLIARARDAYDESGIHRAASSPRNSLKPPTEAQAKAGNYPLGVASWQGIPLRIENPCGTKREGKDPDGTPWCNTMAAHYGYIAGTRGADGDGIDIFLGPDANGTRAWILNQTDAAGEFDEHKVLAGFLDADHATAAYRTSYTPDWDRFRSPIPVTLSQLKWWLKHGNHAIEFHPDHVPPEAPTMTPSQPTLDGIFRRVFWDSATAEPMHGATLDSVLYNIRRHDGDDGLLLDPLTMADVMEGEQGARLDAMVVEVGRLRFQMDALVRVMNSVGGDLKVLAHQISDPVRRFGGAHVAVIFELSDGQTITVWFHNPDATPAKLTPADELIAWKWVLNKKDFTIWVSPESGKELEAREVARRAMRLAAKNSPAFARANAKRADTMKAIEGLRKAVESQKAELAGLHAQIEDRKALKAAEATMKPEWQSLGSGDLTAADYAKILAGGEAAMLYWQDRLDPIFGQRIVEVRNALRGMGWEGEQWAWPLTKGGAAIDIALTQVGAGRNVAGVKWIISGNLRPENGGKAWLVDDLKTSPDTMAAWLNDQVAEAAAPQIATWPSIQAGDRVKATKANGEVVIGEVHLIERVDTPANALQDQGWRAMVTPDGGGASVTLRTLDGDQVELLERPVAAPAPAPAADTSPFTGANDEAKSLLALGGPAYDAALKVQRWGDSNGVSIEWEATTSVPAAAEVFDAVASPTDLALIGDFVKTAKSNGAETVWVAVPANHELLRTKGIDVRQIRKVTDALAEYRDELGHRVVLSKDRRVMQLDAVAEVGTKPTGPVNVFAEGDKVTHKETGKDYTVTVQKGHRVFVKGQAEPFHANHLRRTDGKVAPRIYLDTAEALEVPLLDSAELAAVLADAATRLPAGAVLDAVDPKHAIVQLEVALDVVTTNEPINRAEGKLDQADLELAAAASYRDAIAVLTARMDDASWHSRTMEAMKRKTDAELRYIAKDATEAAEAGEKIGNPKAGQYRDEAHYANMELARRRKGGTRVMDAAAPTEEAEEEKKPPEGDAPPAKAEGEGDGEQAPAAKGEEKPDGDEAPGSKKEEAEPAAEKKAEGEEAKSGEGEEAKAAPAEKMDSAASGLSADQLKALRLISSGVKDRDLTEEGAALISRHAAALLAKGLIVYGGGGKAYVVEKGVKLDDATGGLFGTGDSGFLKGSMTAEGQAFGTVFVRGDGMALFEPREGRSQTEGEVENIGTWRPDITADDLDAALEAFFKVTSGAGGWLPKGFSRGEFEAAMLAKGWAVSKGAPPYQWTRTTEGETYFATLRPGDNRDERDEATISVAAGDINSDLDEMTLRAGVTPEEVAAWTLKMVSDDAAGNAAAANIVNDLRDDCAAFGKGKAGFMGVAGPTPGVTLDSLAKTLLNRKPVGSWCFVLRAMGSRPEVMVWARLELPGKKPMLVAASSPEDTPQGAYDSAVRLTRKAGVRLAADELTRKQRMAENLRRMGYEFTPGTWSALKREGDITLKIEVNEDAAGAITFLLAKLDKGVTVDSRELPDDTARTAEENTALANALVKQFSANTDGGYIEWEDALTRLVEERDEATRSDAQGMVEAQDMMNKGILRKLHGEGVTPEQAYDRLWPAADPAPAAADPGAALAALAQFGWAQPEGTWGPEWMARMFPGGRKGTANPEGLRRVMASVRDGDLVGTHGVDASGGSAVVARVTVGDDPVASAREFNEQAEKWAAPAAAPAPEPAVTPPAPPAPEPAPPIEPPAPPAEDPNVTFLREVNAGTHDAMDVTALLDRIETAAKALEAAGALAAGSEAERLANDAINRWVDLEQKANG